MVAITVAVMGSTGSIGTQTLEIIQDHPEEFEVVALGASKSVELLVEQATKYNQSVFQSAFQCIILCTCSAKPRQQQQLTVARGGSASIRISKSFI